ncbi:MAG: hypothetical protein KGZ32_05790, partial [Dethiobacter sp.]|nr:hypothetical protein [Dethiobacter sp.]
SPGSKKKVFEEKGRYFERFNFSLADVYRALSHYACKALRPIFASYTVKVRIIAIFCNGHQPNIYPFAL